MAKHNTHRAAGRAHYPAASRFAYQGVGGAAMLGTALVGSAFAAQSASASQLPEWTQGGTIHEGVSGDQVETLQSFLNTQGADLPVTGYFGDMTEDAVEDYQAGNDLQVDGRVGPATTSSINASIGGGGAGAAAATATAAPATNASSSESSSSQGQAIVDAARGQIGVPYVYAGDSPGQAFDCSGLTQYAYAQAGIDLPRVTGDQAAGGTTISESEAQPGDLVSWPGHIGIYAGNGKVIDAGNSKGSVSERSIWGNPTFVTYR